MGTNITLKGIAIRVGDKRNAAVCFDTEMVRVSGGWSGGFVSPLKLMSRGEFPTNEGAIVFTTANKPGWSTTLGAPDPRPKPYGPLPAEIARYRGLYLNDDWVIVACTVGKTEVYEMPDYESTEGIFTRTFHVGVSDQPLYLNVCETLPHDRKLELVERIGNGQLGHVILNGITNMLAVAIWDGPKNASFETKDGSLYLKLPPLAAPAKFKLLLWKGDPDDGLEKFGEFAQHKLPVIDPKRLAVPGSPRWSAPIETRGVLGDDSGPYAVDTLTLPFENPWKCEMLVAGLDFFSDGTRAAICTFHGDVWIVSGIDESLQKLTWKRYAAGLFHALGLKIVNDEIYVVGRDQITHLHDFNGDGEADFYENFNNDCIITKNFHEFALDLQTDREGNFYYGKAGPVRNGGRGFEEVMDHHGCLFKVSKDGKKFEVVATGFRAPNGLCLGPNDELTCGDNEGTWTPACRLNLVKPGGFYGVVDLAHRAETPTDYDKPLCWMPKSVDNSSGGQVWVDNDKWGPLNAHLLLLSYGTCSLFHVLKEEVGGQIQGGVVRFPVNFASGIMRARFNPKEHQLYLAGLKGWQTSAAYPGCLQRVRYTGKPVQMPFELHVKKTGVQITFTQPLDESSARDPQNYAVEQWNYIWTSAYGSPEISTKTPPPKPGDEGGEWAAKQMSVREHDGLDVKSASVSADKRTVFLEIPGIAPVMQMQIKFNLKSADGTSFTQEIVHTINRLGN